MCIRDSTLYCDIGLFEILSTEDLDIINDDDLDIISNSQHIIKWMKCLVFMLIKHDCQQKKTTVIKNLGHACYEFIGFS